MSLEKVSKAGRPLKSGVIASATQKVNRKKPFQGDGGTRKICESARGEK
jgi:hypothetical protein